MWTPGKRVETWGRVWAIMERVISWVRERSFITSIGPKASRASKPGKIRRPKVLGTGDCKPHTKGCDDLLE